MFLLPFDRKIDWSNAPVVTIFLVLINVLVFFVIQTGDRQRLADAMDMYFSSGLHKIEFPRYMQHQQKNGNRQPEITPDFNSKLRPEQQEILWALQSDYGFMKDLESDKIITPDDQQYEKWKQTRKQYESLIASVVWYEHGLKPGKPELTDLVFHMFLHADIMHLLGNMFFLFAVGFIVESVIGHRVYLLSYFLAGIGSSVPDLIFNQHSLVSSIGASGAISGIMGMYAVLFGLRRVNFFYFLFVYFDYTKAPALLLLVLWLGYEVAKQILFGDVSNINYSAHIGGLVSGSMLAYLLTRYTPAVDKDYLDASEREQRWSNMLDQADAHIQNLEHKKAVPVLRKILTEKPDDQGIMLKLYNATKFQPQSPDYHQAAARIFQIKSIDPATDRLVAECYEDYVQRTGSATRIPADTVKNLVLCLLRTEKLTEAEHLIHMMAKNPAHYPTTPVQLLKLARLFLREKQRSRATTSLQLLVGLFPDCDEAQIGRQLLDSLKA